MNSQKFGPLAWSLLHSLPSLLNTPAAQQQQAQTTGTQLHEWPESIIEAFVLLMYSNAMILPCVYCRESYRIFIRAIDLRKWLQGPKRLQPVTSASVDQYLYTLHNMVNQKLDKPWHFDMHRAIPTNLLHNERALMTTLFEWLYILFLNYPETLLVTASGSSVHKSADYECCDAACRKANRQMFNINKKSGNGGSSSPSPQLCPRLPSQCMSESLARALEHVKRQANYMSYMASANEQGVTLGSYLNKHLVKPVYDTMLSADAKKAVDLYTFSKVCWYIVMLRNFLRLLLYSAEQHVLYNSTAVATARSPEALRSLKQLYQSFIEPNTIDGAAFQANCACYRSAETLHKCMLQHMGAWASSDEAVKHLHFARQLWDAKTESLVDTRRRIEHYRASGH